MTDFPAILKGKSKVFSDKLGEPVKWTPSGGSAKNLRGIYSDEPNVVYSGDTPIQTTTPIVKIWTKDIPGIAVNDTIYGRERTRKVMRFTHNELTGETTIYLKES